MTSQSVTNTGIELWEVFLSEFWWYLWHVTRGVIELYKHVNDWREFSALPSFPMINIQLAYHFVANLSFLEDIANCVFAGNMKLCFLKSIGAKPP
jgi:hypothetical protein